MDKFFILFPIYSTKNPTPHQLALFAGGFVAVVLLIINTCIWVFFPNSLNGYIVFLAPIIVFLAAYLAFADMLKHFIYRKIKVIYKTIHTLKHSKNSGMDKINLRNNILDEVHTEVMEWAKDRTQEIATLREMEEYRRDFIGNVSHELKTPIFNLQGYLDTLLDGGYQDTNILVPYLQKAMQNVERLSTIVEDLNTIAELEANQLALDMEKFNIKELVKEVFEDLEMKAQERNIRLSFKEINNFKPIYVLADYERIRQVVDNLVVNAINYGRNYGRVFVSFYDMDKNILVEVSDNGIGIEAEHLLHVFDRFYRVDKARSRNTGGSGLGLAIVKHVIEAHGQTISARSTPNIGSTFGFTLAKA